MDQPIVVVCGQWTITNMKTIICSHGFGVRADSMGMFTDVAHALSGYDFTMFDYNDYAANGDSTFLSLSDQAKKLQKKIDDAAAGEIELLCHSQGCLIPSFVDLSRVKKIILLAPPGSIESQNIIDLFKDRVGAAINRDGVSSVPRSDGTTTYFPKEYFDEIDAIQPLVAYRKIADIKPTTIICATKDEMLGVTKVDQLKNAKLIDIDSDHNFTGANRQKLIDVLRTIL